MSLRSTGAERSGEASPSEYCVGRWFGSLFHERASHDVYLLLEALGGDVVTFLGSVTPPTAFERPRGLPSSVCRASLSMTCDRFHELGSPSETHPETAAS